MSVIHYNSERIVSIINSLIARKELVESAIKDLPHFEQKTRYIKEEKIECYIWFMLQHLRKANAFAYMSQYGDDIREEIKPLTGEEKGEEYSNLDLVSNIEGLDYNLADNDGNRYCDPGYYSILSTIIQTLTDTYKEEIKSAEAAVREMYYAG